MPLTPKQEEAKQELIRRGLISDVNAPSSIIGPEPTLPTMGQTRSLAEQPSAPSKIYAEPIPERDEFNRWATGKLASGEVEAVKPSFLEGLWANLPQMAGGTVGGLAGAKVGAMAGAKIPVTHPYLKGVAILGGAAGGAFLGGAGGKGWQQYYRMKTDPTGKRPREMKDLYLEQLWAGTQEAISELAGRGITKGISMAAKPILQRFPLRLPFVKQALVPGAEEAQELLGKYGTHITYGQALRSRVADLAEDVGEGSWVGGGGLYRLKRITQPAVIRQIFDDSLDDFAKQIGGKLSPSEVGEVLLDVINKEDKTFHAVGRSFYKHVDNLIRKAGGNADIIDLRPLKKYAGQQLSERGSLATSQTGETILNKILKHPDYVNFHQGSSVRSQLLMIERSLGANKDVAEGTVKTLSKIMNRQIDKSAASLTGDPLMVWREANVFWRTGKEKFGKTVIRNLQNNLTENPERYAGIIFKPKAAEQVRAVMNVIDDKSRNVLKYGLAQDLFTKAEDKMGQMVVGILPETGQALRPIKGTTFLNSFNNLGNDVLKEVFNDAEIRALRNIGRTAEITQGTAMFGKGGRMLVTLTQAGLVVSMASFQPTRPGALPIILGPYIAARMATNPTTSAFLSTGMRTLPEAPIASTLATRILREAAKYQVEEKLTKHKVAEPRMRPLTKF